MLYQQQIKKKMMSKESVWGIGLAMGPVLGFVIFGLIPAILALFMSLMKIRGYSFDNAQFVGFANFVQVLTDPLFYKAIGNTLLSAISMPISLVLSLAIAMLLNNKVPGTKIFRTIFFIPYVCSIVAITTMWKWIFNTEFGIINDIIGKIGMQPIPWITDSRYFMISMIIMGVWSGTGFGIILFSAALGNVSRSYYEAAKIDGATRWEQFRNVTLPAISPTTFYLVIMGIIGALQDFARFQIMGGDIGGPNESGLTIVFYLWRMGFKNVITQGMGLASAVSLLLAVVIILITVLNFKLSKKWVHYD